MSNKATTMSRRAFFRAAGSVGAAAAVGRAVSAPAAAAAGETAVPAPEPRPWLDAWRPAAPARLSERTHELARLGLSGAHGRAMRPADFALDDAAVMDLSADLRYAHAARLVAERAPLRLLPGERIVGSATLLEAVRHQTPAAGVPSTSHTTIGFDGVLRIGYGGLRREIETRLERGGFETAPPLDFAARLVDGPLPGTRALATHPALGHWGEALHRPEYDGPPLTVECWARLRPAAGFSVLVGNRKKESRLHWELYAFAGNGCLAAYLPGYAPNTVLSPRVVTDDRWHHLAMTFDGQCVCLYVDGEQVQKTAVRRTGEGQNGTGNLYVGGLPLNGVPCHGAIAALRLSAGVRRIDAPAPERFLPDAETIALWDFSSRSDDGRRFPDASAVGNDLLNRPSAGRSRGRDLLEAMLLCLDAAGVWHARHLAELERLAAAATDPGERDGYLRVGDALRNVPEAPPETFAEAVQSLWFMYAFQRLLGNWSGLGRLDWMLGPYLERDLAAGRITLNDARELIAHFWIKGTEWAGASDFGGSGDAQHYQNVILAGVDADGNEVTNAVTYLILDVVEELHISDFPIAVRLNSRSPEQLLRRVAEVQRHGGGIVALYNEEVVIPGLVRFGYEEREARTFANDGCWEVLIPGRTAFSYRPFDGLVLLHEVLGLKTLDAPPPAFADFEALYAAYRERLSRHIDQHHAAADGAWSHGTPAPLISMMIPDCIERGRGYNDRGARYSVLAPHIGGMANIANSLLAIRRLVYEEGALTLAELAETLRRNWDGHEPLRRLVLARLPAYGNDDDAADAMMTRLFNDYAALVEAVRERAGVLRPAGISTFGREIGWRGPAGGRAASPDGHRAEDILATNFSPSPGTDLRGPTAVLKSYCKMDFTRTPNGATVELKIHPDGVRGEAGIQALVGLMHAFQRLGGMFLHIDVVDTAMLLDAQRHPEKYRGLAVRVAGWSARFTTLNRQWQDMIILRTQQTV